MTVLVVGFDSAWTEHNRGAIAGVVLHRDDTLVELGLPRVANFQEATQLICDWKESFPPNRTIIALDQPIIVRERNSMRPVERTVASIVTRLGGGVQPANTSRHAMFGVDAPIWRFLRAFGGTVDPSGPTFSHCVLETYPVLAIAAFNWTLPTGSGLSRLPKYNPARPTFMMDDWCHLCTQCALTLEQSRLASLAQWLRGVGTADTTRRPSKSDQDCVDACICLLVALHYARQQACLMIGDMKTGYMLVPSNDSLAESLRQRSQSAGKNPTQWVRDVTCVARQPSVLPV